MSGVSAPATATTHIMIRSNTMHALYEDLARAHVLEHAARRQGIARVVALVSGRVDLRAAVLPGARTGLRGVAGRDDGGADDRE